MNEENVIRNVGILNVPLEEKKKKRFLLDNR